MKRTIPPKNEIPFQLEDAMNCSVVKNYTQIPNDLIRNPKISGKAKGIQALLLSNREGWKSYITTIKKMMKDGPDAIQSGLKELEKFGYLRRFKYRNRKTKRWAGSFWAYTDTPFIFNIAKQLQTLEKSNFEVTNLKQQKPQPENPYVDYPYVDYPPLENPPLIIPIDNNTNSKEKQFRDFLEYFPNWINDESFQKSLESYHTHRIQKIPLTQEAKKRLANKLKKYPLEIIISALDCSVENGWTGVFPENGNGHKSDFQSTGGAAPVPGKYDDCVDRHFDFGIENP